jgi:hypothetical protein
MVHFQRKVNKVLRELRGVSSGHLSINKTLDEVCQAYYWLHVKGGAEKGCQQYGT